MPINVGPDRPISVSSEDEFGLFPYVENLVDALVDDKQRISTGVVIGLSGEWGSGKSSALNLVDEKLREKYEQSVIVRFDPWLVSARDDLIRQFFTEFFSALNEARPQDKSKTDELRELFKEYDTAIDIGIGLLPGSLKKVVADERKKFIGEGKSLQTIKKNLEEKMQSVDFPIVVLVDEVDRLEDNEVLEIMRLVKSVADFSNVSYLIAFDVDRVVEALGKGSGTRNVKRGRAYLEKIVHHQIPLPSLSEGEIARLFKLKIRDIVEDPSMISTELFREFESAIFPQLLRTPRDLKRCFGCFKVLHKMTKNEVNWLDCLGYSILIIKAPEIAEKIKSDPIFLTHSFDQSKRYFKDVTDGYVAADFLGEDWEIRPEASLLRFLFPVEILDGRPKDKKQLTDFSRIQYHRALKFLIEYGAPVECFSMQEIARSLELDRKDYWLFLDEIMGDADRFDDYCYGLAVHYEKYTSHDHKILWRDISDWIDQNNASMSSVEMKIRLANKFLSVFEAALHRSDENLMNVDGILSAILPKDPFGFGSSLLYSLARRFEKNQEDNDYSIPEYVKKYLVPVWEEKYDGASLIFNNWNMCAAMLMANEPNWAGEHRTKLRAMCQKDVGRLNELIVLLSNEGRPFIKGQIDKLYGVASLKSDIVTTSGKLHDREVAISDFEDREFGELCVKLIKRIS